MGHPPKFAYLLIGRIEKILKDKKHPARPYLIWQNAWYSTKNRKFVKLRRQVQTENAPLFLRPEIIEYIEPLIFLSKEAKNGYTELRVKRSKEKK